MITLSQEQEEALNYIEQVWDKRPVTVLTGYAGTGKSTVINELIRRLNINKSKIAFCAYTGCAAMVLKRKGINACTIHHLIYNTRKDKSGNLYSFLKRTLDNDYKLIIIDEGSFLNDKILDDLLSFNIPIIMLGDDGQLPPVNGKINKFMEQPNAKLTKIFRQANGNTIIDFANNLRTGVFDYTYNDNYIKCTNELSLGMCLWAEQILCCTNKERKEINQIMRQAKGYTDNIPQVGDKLICLKNNWDNMPYTGENYELVNGMTGYVEKILDVQFSPWQSTMEIVFALEFNRDIKYTTIIDLNPFLNRPVMDNKELDLFDFGYAITIHKSQGSQWDKVVVVAKHGFGDTKKLFYTAATRAIKQLVWVS